MPSISGIVSILDEPNFGAVPGSAWMQDLAALSPAPHHVIVRAPISVNQVGQVNMDSLKRALAAYQDAAFPVWLVLHGGLETHYQSLSGTAYLKAMPNATLGLNGDMFQNDYINRFSLSALSVLQGLGDLCPSTVFLWNEPNLDGPSLKPGDHPTKLSSLAAEVFGALLVTTSKRIKAEVPQVTTMIPGALSCLIKFNTDPHGPWVEGYLKSALDSMATYGVHAPYDFSSLCLNLEGIVTDFYAQDCAQALTDVLRAYGMQGGTVIGEWGLPNATIEQDHLDMAASWRALSAHFTTLFAYCHNTEVPNGLKCYGMTTWGIDPSGTIVPHGHTPMYASFQQMLASSTT